MNNWALLGMSYEVRVNYVMLRWRRRLPDLLIVHTIQASKARKGKVAEWVCSRMSYTNEIFLKPNEQIWRRKVMVMRLWGYTERWRCCLHNKLSKTKLWSLCRTLVSAEQRILEWYRLNQSINSSVSRVIKLALCSVVGDKLVYVTRNDVQVESWDSNNIYLCEHKRRGGQMSDVVR